MTFTDRLIVRAKLMRLDKPIGTLLLLWPTLWGLLAGAGEAWPQPRILAIFVVGTLLMRSAGCVINDWADRHFDGHVARTSNRPLVRGDIGSREALYLAATLSFCAFLLILPLNRMVLLLSIPALLLAASYPFTKRFLAIPQAYLGIAFGFGIPMAFAAEQGRVPALGWVMLLANVFWTIAYDTEYAMVDRPDDLKLGIRTSAITFGRFDVLAVMSCYGLFFAFMAAIGVWLGYGPAYYGGLLGGVGIACFHYCLIRGREPERCFRAFLHNNWLGAVVTLGFLIDFSLRHWAR
jgi:4-hydroxybenzoate polyprenyltransferase